jgi:alkanesulfonate monooxygenase SsuD/methylene tetrahydromethanopterin reductase-like flavin-dependent oxidoreductase (luciferase family)
LGEEIRFGVRLSDVISTTATKGSVGDRKYLHPRTGKWMSGAGSRIGLYEELDWNLVRDCVLYAEKLGYHSAILPDHPMIGGARLDCMAALGALAGITSKITLGTMTTNTMRYVPSPALFAKQIATLDYITGGRIYPLGLGAGYIKEEYDAYGFPYGTHRDRFEQLKETIEIMKKMFTEKEATYKGRHFQINNAICEPKPVQKPFPICVGGSGRFTLKLAGEYADFTNMLGSVEDAKERLSIIEDSCRKAGRNWGRDIVKSWAGELWIYEDAKERDQHKEDVRNMLNQSVDAVVMGTPQEIVHLFHRYMELGITYFTLKFKDLPSKRGLKLFADEVMPAFN